MAALTVSVSAQPPRGEKGEPPKRGDGPRPGGGEDFIARLMALDANKDGKLSKDEVTDERLQRIFDRADADKDGSVTKDELAALAKQFPGAGPGGPGGPGGRPGGFGPPGQPGMIMPPFVQDALKLTDEQKQQIAEIQKDVQARIEKVLTEDQRKQLQEMRSRFQPGGRPGEGRPGARPGPDGQGNPPPRKEP
jgi:hypothetical protein